MRYERYDALAVDVLPAFAYRCTTPTNEDDETCTSTADPPLYKRTPNRASYYSHPLYEYHLHAERTGWRPLLSYLWAVQLLTRRV